MTIILFIIALVTLMAQRVLRDVVNDLLVAYIHPTNVARAIYEGKPVVPEHKWAIRFMKIPYLGILPMVYLALLLFMYHRHNYDCYMPLRMYNQDGSFTLGGWYIWYMDNKWHARIQNKELVDFMNKNKLTNDLVTYSFKYLPTEVYLSQLTEQVIFRDTRIKDKLHIHNSISVNIIKTPAEKAQ